MRIANIKIKVWKSSKWRFPDAVKSQMSKTRSPREKAIIAQVVMVTQALNIEQYNCYIFSCFQQTITITGTAMLLNSS
ncbi:hypothetical protein H6G97_21250 [Nostoc flagelliforme FACHB-838]|uniref:Transposase n=1 Tax=Nostoc flagelliforme FACHB-838 TaxID=2692904 RepID=A0ABR8DRA2_9NOSO|nr:hypothetical protein [Nostoc flagelliforme]MBD2531976.1 hypothetical protein [Nostoc flagelliforme FACHB-838]